MPKALIVGASRGLGLGLAEEFFHRGWEVVATARSPEKAEGLAALAQKSGGKVTVAKANIDDVADFDRLHAALGPRSLDVLFVNGGIWIARDKHLRDLSREDVAQMFTTNAIGNVRVAHVLADCMEADGVIAFMTSFVGSVGAAANFLRADTDDLYQATKAALNRLIRSFANRLPDPSLTVLAVSPGWVRTDMGGPKAPLDVATSVKGCVDVVEKARGTRKHMMINNEGKELPW